MNSTRQSTGRSPLPIATLLLLLAGCGGDSPSPPPVEPARPRAEAWLTEITEEVGLTFRHSGGQRDDFPISEIMGAGGALFDHDGDGDLDVYLVNGGPEGGATNRMYSREPDGRFSDVTEASGLGDAGDGMGTALGDVDNDGDLDLLVTNFGPDRLYLNDGGGVFSAAPATAGLDDDLWSSSACFLDYDRDGRLDLYVTTYLDFDNPDKRCTDTAGSTDYCGPQAFRGIRDRIYRGGGDGTFVDVAAEALVNQPINKGLGVLCADFDGDGWTDVYVANDGERNQLWLNRGAGADGAVSFEDRATLLGVALSMFSKPEASMGVAAGDVDDDGDLDLFMTHLDRETNTLYLNLGEDGFVDRTASSGLGPATLAHTGFGTALLDLDLDGDLDLPVVNGRVSRGPSLADLAERQRSWRIDEGVPPRLRDYAEPNLVFLNEGGGRFREAGDLAGALTDRVEVSRGLMAADVDDDGDLDLLITACGGPARLFRNDAPRAGSWLAVRVFDPALRRDALGATVVVRAGNREFLRPVLSSYSYLSSVEPTVHFGLGPLESYDAIEVVWPDGLSERFAGGPANREIELLKGSGEPAP